MASGGGVFSPEEIKYLKSLPSVAGATSKRITYTDDFKRYCIIHYNQGASPVRMFREAGLDPALIGYKRIERCIARWREQQDEILQSGSDESNPKNGLGGGVSSSPVFPGNTWRKQSAQNSSGEADFHVSPERRAIILPTSSLDNDIPNSDLRDLLISQQVRRIDELERQVDMLEALLHTEQSKRQADESAANNTADNADSSNNAVSSSE
ncbi:hypothetical protein BLI708_02210 [Bifidobacterium imperatoris]|uniref:Transposase n=1 Tax=Bifidobacterium imperatoris TaxID=2020965 RepID=A0ABX7S1P9_9BIFI|nr:hypothetical protein [Bifidobacterium imperatoris]QSY58155.1 hypothetical protein BLI708_02210 [Bifidobacterium imperatoris]